MNNDKIKNICEDMKPWLISVRRDFHTTPELGLEEFITNNKIINYLKELKLPYTQYKNHTGVVSFFDNNSSITIGIRADMDALKIPEKSNNPYKSINTGKMHACGHDAHMAIALGVGKFITEFQPYIPVNVKLIFQPAEETIGGAKLMIASGCLDNPTVDYMLGLHVMPYLDTGYIESKYDTLNASTDAIEINVFGKKAHGAYPDEGIDAILVASHIVCALQSIISRNVSPTQNAVLSLGIIQGGIKENIICDKVTIKGTLRCTCPNIRTFIKNKITKIVKNTALAFDANSQTNIKPGYKPLINTNSIVDIIKTNAIDMFGSNCFTMKSTPSLGSEDFSFYLENVPGAFFHLGCKRNLYTPLHTSEFDIDENCLSLGVSLLIKNILSLNEKGL